MPSPVQELQMAYDTGLAQRIREALDGRPGLSEKAMFGGLAFLVDGKMFVGVQDSLLMARVGLQSWPIRFRHPTEKR